MRTVLVTGGAGFIGSHIVRALVSRGEYVRIVDDLSSGSFANLQSVASRVEFLNGSVENMELMQRAAHGVDCIFHHAAMASVPLSLERPLESHHANVTGTFTVLEAARRERVRRVVFASSSSVYGNQQSLAKRESDPLTPLSPYAAAKLGGEHYCTAFHHATGLETVCLRYFNVFGPNQDPASHYAAVIPRFIVAVLSGKRPVIYGDGLQTRDFVYVEDVVQANLLAAASAEAVGKVFNIGRGSATTILELLEFIQSETGPTKTDPDFQAGRAGDVRHSMADITSARELFGFEPHFRLVDGLKRTIDYYRGQLHSESSGTR